MLGEEMQEGWVWHGWGPRLVRVSKLGSILVVYEFLEVPPLLNACFFFFFTRQVLSRQQLWEPDLKCNRSKKSLVFTF